MTAARIVARTNDEIVIMTKPASIDTIICFLSQSFNCYPKNDLYTSGVLAPVPIYIYCGGAPAVGFS